MPSQKKSIKQKQEKIQLTQSPKFIKELKILFKTFPQIPSAPILLEKFKEFKNIPPKWTPNTSIKQLRTDGIIIYNNKKPQGYSLDSNNLNDFISIKPNIGKTTQIEDKSPIPSIKSVKKSEIKQQSGSVLKKKKTTAEIMDKIPSIPKYLLKRLSSNEAKILQMGVFDINRLPLQKIDSHIETLSSARILFDANFVNEKLVSDYIEAKVKYLSKISQKLHEKEDDQLIIKIFIEPMNEGKFDRILTKYMKKFDLDNCASQIIKKVGSKAKKIQLSDFALRKKIVDVLSKRYSKNK